MCVSKDKSVCVCVFGSIIHVFVRIVKKENDHTNEAHNPLYTVGFTKSPKPCGLILELGLCFCVCVIVIVIVLRTCVFPFLW